jgi:hypothetical protein
LCCKSFFLLYDDLDLGSADVHECPYLQVLN